MYIKTKVLPLTQYSTSGGGGGKRRKSEAFFLKAFGMKMRQWGRKVGGQENRRSGFQKAEIWMNRTRKM